MTIAERDDRTRLSARLTRVGEQLYLDMSPLDGADVAPLLLPVHGIYRVELDGDELSLADLNYEQLERLARDGTAGLPMAIDARKNVVITASTAELRRWLVAHAADEGLFAAPTSAAAQGRRRQPLRRADVLTHQLAAQDLADHRLGQLGAELDGRRHLVGRQLLLAEPLQIVDGGRSAPRAARPTPSPLRPWPHRARRPRRPRRSPGGSASTSSTSRGHT